MGKGDRKTRKGKISIRSYGNKRPASAAKKLATPAKKTVAKPAIAPPKKTAAAPARKKV